MRLDESKRQILTLTKKERFENKNLPKVSAEIDRRMNAMGAEEKVTAEQLEALHQELKSRGR